MNPNGLISTPSSSSIRRKSVLNYHHHHINNSDSTICGAANTSSGNDHNHSSSSTGGGGRYSPHPNELFLQHNAKLTLQPGSDDSLSCCLPPPSPAPHNDRFCGNNGSTSSSVGANEPTECFISNHHHHHHQIHPQLLSTSTSTSSLSTNCGSGSKQNHHTIKYISSAGSSSITSNRPSSPNTNRFTNRAGDRFREKHSVTSNNLIDNNGRVTHHTPVHTSVLSSDSYSYLNASAAHTPVKRYIPTPPFAHDIGVYTPGRNVITSSHSGSSSQHLCTLPYRLRVKCCDQGLMQTGTTASPSNSNATHVLSLTDSYTTSPRMRPSGMGTHNSKNTVPTFNATESPIHLHQSEQIQSENSVRPNCNFNVAASTSPTPISPSNIVTVQSSGNNISNRQSMPVTSNRQTAEHTVHTPSIEFVNFNNNGNNVTSGTRVLSPILLNSKGEISVSGSYGQNNEAMSANNSSASTCLHCNTTRRTTGVHQTTQTTGPISPIPMQQSQLGAGTNQCIQDQLITSSSATITPATSETPLSPLPSATVASVALESQQIRFQQVQSSVKIQEMPQPHLNKNVVNNTCQQPISHAQIVSSHQVVSQTTTNAVSQPQRFSTTTRKKRLSQYLRREIARFFGVEVNNEAEDKLLWRARQRRLALRRFGALKTERELCMAPSMMNDNNDIHYHDQQNLPYSQHHTHAASERPDVLPAQDATNGSNNAIVNKEGTSLENLDFQPGDLIERKASVASMISSGVSYLVNALGRGKNPHRLPRQWSRSFAPVHIRRPRDGNLNINEDDDDFYEGLTALQEDEVFFDSPHTIDNVNATGNNSTTLIAPIAQNISKLSNSDAHGHQIYLGERVHGWRTTSITGPGSTVTNQENILCQGQLHQQQSSPAAPTSLQNNSTRGMRISAQLLDSVLENSRRPLVSQRANQKLFTVVDLDDRTDYRPFFTYWINTVQILVLFISLICYGIGPIGLGIEQRTGQVLVTSLSLQTVQHSEQRNIWIGPRNFDLVHMGAKFATCMRRDVKIIDVLFKTRRQERETACCIRNDDSGCVQSSQADCSVRGLFPTKSISTWKKWSPGESGPGGRISGSVCGLDPKYCDAPASIAPYEWPDDITKWPICRKTNSFSQRFRFKDHTAEHMICEVIGHPCCTGVFGECRITTREYCDFVNGYFHEEASLCSQISCLSNVCGMFPFFSVEVPDQFYRLFTSLCLHAGILHLAITVAFQHVFLADLERLIGPLRTAIVYLCSGIAGNLTSVLLVPYKAEVGPLASLTGVVASLIVLLVLVHWKQLRKPHIALLKLIFIGALLFALGTLPCQLNFAGLFAGMISSVFLTIALVPYVSITSYVRKSKINLIWSCFFFHIFVYTIMAVIFYVFPTELTNLNFGEVLTNTFNTNVGISRNGVIGGSGSNFELSVGHGGDVLSSARHFQRQSQNHIYYPENYLITATTLQIIDGNKELMSNNRFNYDITNNINNATISKDISFYANSKKHSEIGNYSKLISKNLRNSTKPTYFNDDRNKINRHVGDNFKNKNKNMSTNDSYYKVSQTFLKIKSTSKLPDFSNSMEEKIMLSLSQETRSQSGHRVGRKKLSDN